MSQGVLLLVVVLGLAVVAVVGYFHYQAEKKRRELLLTWATANGWHFAVTDTTLTYRWQDHPFGEGDHRRTGNVVSGRHGPFDFVAFDYSYQTHSSDGRGNRTTTTHRFAVCAVDLPAFLPRLQVSPENLLTRLGHVVGLSDIDLESESFNRAFRVQCQDGKFASDVLTPRTMEYLLAHPGAGCWRLDGQSLLCWAPNTEHTPASITAQLTTAEAVLRGVPQFVWADYGAAPTPALETPK